MMKKVVMAALAVGVGTGAFAQDVSVDYDKSADFSKTFTVKMGTAWGNPLGESGREDRGGPRREGLEGRRVGRPTRSWSCTGPPRSRRT